MKDNQKSNLKDLIKEIAFAQKDMLEIMNKLNLKEVDELIIKQKEN